MIQFWHEFFSIRYLSFNNSQTQLACRILALNSDVTFTIISPDINTVLFLSLPSMTIKISRVPTQFGCG
ncbi:hypothetical protein P243_1463 [Klebsiella pneumoniae subsp. pneumoniae 1158]|nr:hypothetical protein P243_1463 [Klebsiella pneumoniae subsp. pneumoniae 1158]